MGLIIQDGTGKGHQVKVSDENQLVIRGEIHHIQHHFSRIAEQSYQSLSTITIAASGTHVCHHIKNTSSVRFMAISHIRLQGVGFTGLPDPNTYIEIGKGLSYSSGGNAITPSNVNLGSCNVAEVEAYSEPNLTGTFEGFEKWFVEPSAQEERLEKWGSIILQQNDEITIRLVTDKAAGTVKTRISFVMIKNDA